MSALVSTSSSYCCANTRAAAALCAMIITKHEAATGTRSRHCCHVTDGQRSGGRPPATGPSTAMPCAANPGA